VVLDDVERRAVWVPEGVGHAFLVTGGPATVSYLCTTTYAPGRERIVRATSVGVDWGVADDDLVLSDKDAAAPTLAEAIDAGWLPRYADCQAL
jgi:dTDP-4-dehydrorhamnose 3,5-epimerase